MAESEAPDGLLDVQRSLEERKHELEVMKFHWDKWKEESKAFWGRAVLGAALLTVSIAVQFQVLTVDSSIGGFSLKIPTSSPLFHGVVNIFSWFLWAFICFKFTDLLRHRVPEWMEAAIHTNSLPNPFNEHLGLGKKYFALKKYNHLLYLTFPAYAIVMAALLAVASWKVIAEVI